MEKNSNDNVELIDETIVESIGGNVIKKFISKYMLVFVAAIFLIAIVVLNVSWFIFAPWHVDHVFWANEWQVWMGIVLSLVSAIFGILNITTYSLYNPKSKHKNKFKIFIVFNFIAVIALAIVNITSDLWFLVFENILFALSGVYQYYQWFIKPNKVGTLENLNQKNPEFTNEIGFHYEPWTSKKAIIYFSILPFVMAIASFASIGISAAVFGQKLSELSSRAIVGGVVDGVAFTLSFSAAMMVGKKLTNSQWIYIVSDVILIIWWGYLLIEALFTNGLSGTDPHVKIIDEITATNLVMLFSFYLSSNIINIKNWK